MFDIIEQFYLSSYNWHETIVCQFQVKWKSHSTVRFVCFIYIRDFVAEFHGTTAKIKSKTTSQ
jgi:hypothetical protein